METRSMRIVSMANQWLVEKDRKLLDNLDIPLYESTKGTCPSERDTAIQRYCLVSAKPVALVRPLDSPFKKIDDYIVPTQPRARINLNEFLNAATSSQSPQVGLNEAVADTEDITEDINELFSDSGSEYVPSVDVVSNTSSGEVSESHENFEFNCNNDIEIRRQSGIVHKNKRKFKKCNDIEIRKQCPIIYENRQKKLKTDDALGSDNLISNNNEFLQDESSKYIIISAAEKLNGKRIRDKGHSCYFCHKLVINNLARHFEVNHNTESNVARILAKPKTSKERRDAFLNLSRCGDFYHNCETLALKKGELILTRRPTPNEIKYSSYTDYGPCPECLGFMLKKHIWHHLKYSCKSKPPRTDETTMQNKRMPNAESSALLNGILGQNVSFEFTNDIIDKFKNDAVSQSCKEDNTILKFGAFLYEKYDNTQSELIRQSMRQLGRLTIELRKHDKDIIVLKDALIPEKFDVIVKAVKQLCVSTKTFSNRPEFGIPSLALKIGYALRKCISIERGQALRAGDLKSNTTFMSFLTLLDIEWSVRISSNALATLYSRKKTATDLLPITSDLVKLSNYIDKEINRIKTDICYITSAKWTKLASLTLSRIILFNKRRSGEASKMTMTDYASRPEWDGTGTQEMKNSLTSFENKLASSLTMIRITGKRGRIVPVILTKEMKESVDLLILNRVKSGIANENPYIFALAASLTSHMRGHDCLKKWCIEAELQSPNLITSTKLRKYVATVCQIFNLSENEYDWLARHLGHDVRVHREFYRLQENAVELTKISRLLLAVDQGEAHKYSGKDLKDINIEDLPTVEEDDEDEEEETSAECFMPTESTILQLPNSPQMINNLESPKENLQHNEDSSQLQKRTKGKQATKIKSKDGRRDYSRRKPWSNEQQEIILKEFKTFIKSNSLPGKEKCCALIKTYPLLGDRKWSDLKFFIKNYLVKINKKTTHVK